MSPITDFLLCVNCFFCGAVSMLIGLCIQPEVVGLIRKVYCYDFSKHREKHEKDEGMALLQTNLNHLYDLTRQHCVDDMDAAVGAAWDNVDQSVSEIEAKIDGVPFATYKKGWGFKSSEPKSS